MALFQGDLSGLGAGRRVRGTATAVPRESAVPYAVVCSWKVPLGTTGKLFRARIATDVVWLDESPRARSGCARQVDDPASLTTG